MDNSVPWKILVDDMMALRIYVCDGKFPAQGITNCFIFITAEARG